MSPPTSGYSMPVKGAQVVPVHVAGTLYRPTPAPDRWAHFLGYTKDERPREAPE